ncbi:EamA family transporter [Acinetobacter boissieri]|uniref:Inner membrane transporter RhtA n=1 Tax=Acinetobacter boissieri TaxID=1219383 RepID=A0A1G6HZ56_9GAMM|nr:EamA family transporter [Acinetobacter boissieri]SDB99552.1 inner membrane transporter RhtA [Acinetobacter boissieri]
MPNTYMMAVVYMILSMVSYQISASIAKHLMEQLDPISVTLLRMFFAAIIVCIMFRSWKIIPQLKTLKWRYLLIYSLSLGLMNILFYLSLGRLPQGIAVGLEFLGPLGLAFLSIKKRSDFIWVMLTIIGIALMVPWTQLNSLKFSFVGAACSLGAGLCWAFYIYYGQRVIKLNIGMHALSIALVISTLLLLPVTIFQHSPIFTHPEFWLSGIIIAVLATAIPYTLDLLALKQLSSISYGTLSSLSPVLAALSGLVFLNEFLSLTQWFSLLLIMIAAIGVTLNEKNS